MPDKEYLTEAELEIEARAKAATRRERPVLLSTWGLLAADIIPALLSTLRAERAKIEWLQELEIKAIDRATHFENKFTAERAKYEGIRELFMEMAQRDVDFEELFNKSEAKREELETRLNELETAAVEFIDELHPHKLVSNIAGYRPRVLPLLRLLHRERREWANDDEVDPNEYAFLKDLDSLFGYQSDPHTPGPSGHTIPEGENL